MVTDIGCDMLAHPVAEFNTVKVPLYVPATAAPGIVTTIGLAANAKFTTSVNPCACAAASKSILY